MRKFSAVLAILSMLAAPAGAHQDRVLQLRADGSIAGLPASFGPAQLIVDGLGSKSPRIQLRIGANQTTLPPCAARMIRTTDRRQIQLSGSWYHDETIGLPYYLAIHFMEPGSTLNRMGSSRIELLFNLHNARLIEVKQFKATPSGDGESSKALPQSCSA